MNKKIEKYISKRNDICICNKYEIYKEKMYEDDFHFVIYYIDENKCKIIVRRLDYLYGWVVNVIIKIYNIHNNEYQKISIGSSLKNKKELYYYTNIKIFPVNYEEQSIPKVIIQTSNNDFYKNIYHYNSVQTLLELNPEYEYKFFDDKDRREFIKIHFDSNVLDSYDILFPGAYKADLFRYCYLFIHGGCYFDNKYILRMSLHKIMKHNDTDIYCKDRHEDLMFNSVIMTVSNSIELQKCINEIVENTKNNFYGTNSLEPTGPKLLNKYTFHKNIQLKHYVIGNNSYKESMVLLNNNLSENLSKNLSKNLSENNLSKNLFENNLSKNLSENLFENLFGNTYYKNYYLPNSIQEYTLLYNNRKIYYKNISKIDNFIILVFPNHHNDIFYFDIIDNNIIIKRMDENKGWGQDLKIKVINNTNNNETIYTIGSSLENIYILHFNEDETS